MIKHNLVTYLSFINAVEKLAFEMKPPNQYTPRFVLMCIEARSYINGGDGFEYICKCGKGGK